MDYFTLGAPGFQNVVWVDIGFKNISFLAMLFIKYTPRVLDPFIQQKYL